MFSIISDIVYEGEDVLFYTEERSSAQLGEQDHGMIVVVL